MSNAISRRPRAIPMSATSSEAADGGSGPIASDRHWREAGSVKETARETGANETAGGGAAGEMDPVRASTSGEEGVARDEDSDQENLPPPFTMALAVMLTGLRLFVVDQVGAISVVLELPGYVDAAVRTAIQ